MGMIMGSGNNTNDPQGSGPRTTLMLTSAEARPLVTIDMPPRRSFGIGAAVFGIAGSPVAWLRTAQGSRPSRMSRSSYHIFATRPQFQGQEPTVLDYDSTHGYLLATVSRAPFKTAHTVANAAGVLVFTGRHHVLLDEDAMWPYLLDAGGAGVCHMSKRPSRPPMWNIKLAQGVDALLCVLIKLAADL